MPTHDGKKLVIESVSRTRNQARIVVTVEVEVLKGKMNSLPAYLSDATDYLRVVLEHREEHIKCVVMDLLSEVTDSSVDVLDVSTRADK